MCDRNLFYDLRNIALFVSLFCVLNTFSQTIECETTFVNGMYISESEGAIAKDNMSGCKFKIVTRPDDLEYYYIISYNGKIGNQGMSILRQYNESNREAKFYFTNGKSYTYTVRIADHTPDDWKEFEGLADMYIVFFPVDKVTKFQGILKQVELFNNVDISYITIGSYTLQFKSKGIKSSLYFRTLWKDMYNHGGWDFLTQSTGSNSSSSPSYNSSSTSPSYTIKNNLELRDMLVKPLGFVPSNLQNDTYSSIKNCLKAKFKVDDSGEKDNKQLLYVWESENSVTENMNYHGLNFDSFRLSEDKYSRSIMYHFYISKSSSPNPYSYLDIIIRDFNNAGIPLSYEKSDNTYQKASGYINIGSTTYSIDVDDYRVRWDFTISIIFRK